MSTSTIISSKVKIIPTEELINFIKLNASNDFPEVLKSIAQSCGKSGKCSDKKNKFIVDVDVGSDTKQCPLFLSLYDFYCLKKTLNRLRMDNKINNYLYEFLEKCSIILPENAIIPRNEELEARCEKLRAAQANTAYLSITKNVDVNIKQIHEDSFAFQLKEVNRQIIAVVQFVASVIAGFVFGFLGVELIIGNLDFGFRLLLGIMCALIIALAEIYFLAKKLSECDDVYANKVKQD